MFHVETAAYCGMRLPHDEFWDEGDARDRVAKRIHYLRREGFEVAKLAHHEWEVLEPEDSMMVPDCCGILRIRYVPGMSDEEIDEEIDWEDE